MTGERLLRSAVARFSGLHLPPVLPAAIDTVALAEQIIVAPDEAAARAVLTAHGL